MYKVNKFKIKFPKKISKKKLRNFFKIKGLGKLLDFVDDDFDNNEIDPRVSSKAQPPDLNDLYRLYQFIVLNKRTMPMEFGCGYSTLVFAAALKENEKSFKSKSKNNYKKKPFERCEYPFQLFTIDNNKKFLKISKNRINKLFKKKLKINFCFSEAHMTNINENIAVTYEKLPQINPDFIYIDGPSQWGVKGKINNITTAHPDMMPMSCDLIKIENFLTPGTIIVLDGRTANARFLYNNFKRHWQYFEDKENDQNILVLSESPLGKHNIEQLRYYQFIK